MSGTICLVSQPVDVLVVHFVSNWEWFPEIHWIIFLEFDCDRLIHYFFFYQMSILMCNRGEFYRIFFLRSRVAFHWLMTQLCFPFLHKLGWRISDGNDLCSRRICGMSIRMIRPKCPWISWKNTGAMKWQKCASKTIILPLVFFSL